MSHDLFSLESVLFARTSTSTTRIQARALLRGLGAHGFGPGFIYLGGDAWREVAGDARYACNHAFATLYERFLAVRSRLPSRLGPLCFWGVGGPGEVLTTTTGLGAEPKAVHLVDMNSVALTSTHGALVRAGLTCPIRCHRLDMAAPIKPPCPGRGSFHVLKGGTSGNLTPASLERVLAGVHGRAYVDFFVDPGGSSDNELLEPYTCPSVRALATKNIITLAERAGLKPPRDVSSHYVLDVHSRHDGRVVIGGFAPPERWSVELGTRLPERVEMFRSHRRVPDAFATNLARVCGVVERGGDPSAGYGWLLLECTSS